MGSTTEVGAVIASNIALILCYGGLNENLAEASHHSRLKVWQLQAYSIASALWFPFILFFIWNEWVAGIKPVVSLALVWAPVMFLMDVFFSASQPSIEMEKAERKQGQYVNITTIVMSATFAFGVCFSAINSNSAQRNRRAAILTLAGLLMGVAFVVPVFEAEGSSDVAIQLQTITKCACIYSVGLFICGAAIELSVG